MSAATTYTPPRSLILATPAGTYVTITLAPENGWGPAALVGALLLAVILWGGIVLRSAARSLAVRRATKKAKKTGGEQ
ncbi:hypothetical protein [Streptomyces formicae]